jgi:hypothetical protein
MLPTTRQVNRRGSVLSQSNKLRAYFSLFFQPKGNLVEIIPYRKSTRYHADCRLFRFWGSNTSNMFFTPCSRLQSPGMECVGFSTCQNRYKAGLQNGERHQAKCVSLKPTGLFSSLLFIILVLGDLLISKTKCAGLLVLWSKWTRWTVTRNRFTIIHFL